MKRRRLTRELTREINRMAHREAQRRYAVLAPELKTRALELVDLGMPMHRLLQTIAEEFGITNRTVPDP